MPAAHRRASPSSHSAGSLWPVRGRRERPPPCGTPTCRDVHRVGELSKPSCVLNPVQNRRRGRKRARRRQLRVHKVCGEGCGRRAPRKPSHLDVLILGRERPARARAGWAAGGTRKPMYTNFTRYSSTAGPPPHVKLACCRTAQSQYFGRSQKLLSTRPPGPRISACCSSMCVPAGQPATRSVTCPLTHAVSRLGMRGRLGRRTPCSGQSRTRRSRGRAR